MASTITHTGGTVTPHAVEGFRSSRPARTKVQDVLNRPAPNITYRAFGLRTGSFRLVFETEASALAAEAALSVPQTLAMSNPEVPALSMSFVIADGDLEVEQDGEVATLWRVIVPFQEVAP